MHGLDSRFDYEHFLKFGHFKVWPGRITRSFLPRVVSYTYRNYRTTLQSRTNASSLVHQELLIHFQKGKAYGGGAVPADYLRPWPKAGEAIAGSDLGSDAGARRPRSGRLRSGVGACFEVETFVVTRSETEAHSEAEAHSGLRARSGAEGPRSQKHCQGTDGLDFSQHIRSKWCRQRILLCHRLVWSQTWPH